MHTAEAGTEERSDKPSKKEKLGPIVTLLRTAAKRTAHALINKFADRNSASLHAMG